MRFCANGRKKRHSPLFSLETWSQYEPILEDGPSTNNVLESWNRTWNMIASKYNLWKIIQHLKKQDAEARRVLLSNTVGQDLHNNPGRKEFFVESRERLKRVVSQWAQIPESDFVSQIGAELAKVEEK